MEYKKVKIIKLVENKIFQKQWFIVHNLVSSVSN